MHKLAPQHAWLAHTAIDAVEFIVTARYQNPPKSNGMEANKIECNRCHCHCTRPICIQVIEKFYHLV